MAFFPEFKLADNHNNAAGLASIEDIIPAGDYRGFVVPDGFATFNPGVLRVRADGITIETGYPSAEWLFGGMTRLQYNYLRATYCAGGGLSGEVTVRVMIETGAYANFNAILTVPPLPVINQRRKPGGFEDVSVTFTFMEAL